ncbi:MAG TPA: thermostable hemolysin [Casimicrobiaceae bacterium]|nr:thermostable hemolysin [Casimicrobiaceae bacterium]
MRTDGGELRLHPRRAATRALAESFIQSVYRARYGAEIRHWAPSLVSFGNGTLVAAAAGYRRASGPLFLERYLHDSVDALIAQRAGVHVPRSAVFEVGHFAAIPGAGRALMVALGRHLSTRGCTWVVCTATRELRVLFARMGVRAVELGPALASKLGADAAAWGTYYDHAPVVLAGALAPGVAALARPAPT